MVLLRRPHRRYAAALSIHMPRMQTNRVVTLAPGLVRVGAPRQVATKDRKHSENKARDFGTSVGAKQPKTPPKARTEGMSWRSRGRMLQTSAE